MKKNKGFTLIELLAVIVVLAVIALIATPIVLKLVNNAKEGAAESSATAYIKAVENGIMAKLIKEPNTSFKGTFTVSQDKTKIVNESGVEINVDVKGNLPAKDGVVTIDENGTVTSAAFNISNYEVKCTTDNCKVKGKKVQEEEKESETSILRKAKALVYDENGTCKTDGSTYNYMGGCYIKGANSSNYAWYNGFMWRIMGINSDDTVRLIADEPVTTLSYGPANSALTYATNEGYIHDWLNEYFYNNLNSTKSIIKEGAYFCSESSDSTGIRTTCTTGNEVTAKVGLISIDEYYLADFMYNYLEENGQRFWTMTPSSDSKVWVATELAEECSVTSATGVRPVINVSSTANITSGDGSKNSFYVLEENKISSTTGTLSEKVTSGEYVNLEGHTYRVVSKGSDGVKLILQEYYQQPEGIVYTMSYGNDNTFTINSGIGKKLNTDILSWLGLSNSDKIVETTYYQGDGFGSGTPYTDTLKQSNGIKAKVGLIQVGDILNSYNDSSTASMSAFHYWTMNKHSSAPYVWISQSTGVVGINGVNAESSIRPVITVRNDLNITAGSGTWNNPYEI